MFIEGPFANDVSFSRKNQKKVTRTPFHKCIRTISVVIICRSCYGQKLFKDNCFFLFDYNLFRLKVKGWKSVNNNSNPYVTRHCEFKCRSMLIKKLMYDKGNYVYTILFKGFFLIIRVVPYLISFCEVYLLHFLEYFIIVIAIIFDYYFISIIELTLYSNITTTTTILIYL